MVQLSSPNMLVFLLNRLCLGQELMSIYIYFSLGTPWVLFTLAGYFAGPDEGGVHLLPLPPKRVDN